MMIMNRIKTSMMMAAVAVMTIAATGCTEEEPKTPAEALLEAAQDGNKRIDNIVRNHEVLTVQIVAETLAPIDKANEAFNAELIAWQDNPAPAEYQTQELQTYQKAGVEIANLTAKLDAQGFALGSAGSDTCGSGGSGEDCECSEVTTTSTTDIARGVATADDPQGIEEVTETVYWKRISCRVACGAAQALCSAACGPIVVGGVTVPLAVACVAACGVAGGLCQEGCASAYPNCR